MEAKEFEYLWPYIDFMPPITIKDSFIEDTFQFLHRIEPNGCETQLNVSSIFMFANENIAYKCMSSFIINGENYEDYKSIIVTLIYKHIIRHAQYIEENTKRKITYPSFDWVYQEAFY